MPSSKKPTQLARGHWDILRVVWELQPCAAPSVQEALHASRQWSHSTVRTLMDRMVAQGLLTTEKIRNLYLYRAAITPEQARRSEALHTLETAFNGALTPMVQCLLDTNDLTGKDLAELEALIREKRKNKTP
jgi:BlaI family transcriptional regulator, penicillinase repressor